MKSATRLLLVVVFVLTLGAGIVAGLLASHLPATRGPAVQTVPTNSPLAEELELSSEQRQQMQKIWEGVRDLSSQSLHLSQKLQQERDDAIAALIPADKREQYNQALRSYQDANAALKGRRQAAFDKAVKETNGILSEPQREKYKAILKKRLGIEVDHAHDPLQDSSV